MKKLLITFTALAASYALNSQAAPTMDLDLAGTVDKNCDVSSDDGSATADLTDLDLESDAEVRAYDLTLSCNYIGSAEVTFTSANDGYLAHDSEPSYNIPYEVAISTDGGLTVGSFGSLAGGEVVNAPTPLGTVVYPSYIRLDPPSVVAAGSYADTITVSVVTN